MINCKKLRFYNRFTVDFTVVGGQIGCPYFMVIFFTVYAFNTLPISAQRRNVGLPKTYCFRLQYLIHWQSPITESPPSIDIHGVKHDRGKKQWCIPCNLTQSSVGARMLGTLYFFTLALFFTKASGCTSIIAITICQ